MMVRDRSLRILVGNTMVFRPVSKCTTTTSTNIVVERRLQRCIARGLQWSLHMSLPAVLLPSLASITGANNISIEQYAAAVARHLHTLRDMQLWVPLQLGGGGTDDTTRAQQLDLFCSLLNHPRCIHGCLILESMPITTASNTTTSNSSAVTVADWLRRLHVWIGQIPAWCCPRTFFSARGRRQKRQQRTPVTSTQQQSHSS